MKVEEAYEDVLQNIEFAVVALFKRQPAMTDYAVLRTYEALVQTYSAEAQGRTVLLPAAEGIEAELLQAVRQMCEWRLGRTTMPGAGKDGVAKVIMDIPSLVLCLKRLIKSVKKWTKHYGRQGYLNFVSEFIK